MVRVKKEDKSCSCCAGASVVGSSRPTAKLFQLCFLLSCHLFPAIGSLSLKPPAEEILNKHLCPNPVLSATSKLLPTELAKILTIRLQPRNRSNTYFSRFRPCTFIEDPTLATPSSFPVQHQFRHPGGDGEDNSSSSSSSSTITPATNNPRYASTTPIIRIQSINLNISPWNFSTATGECSKFILFRSWSEYGNGYPVMCGRENFDQFLGPYGHPMILYYHLRDQGMSFPLFHPNYEPLISSASSSSLSSSSSASSFLGTGRDQSRNMLELKYMLIYYSVRAPDGKWTCRLQQYTINPLQDACPSWSATPASPICGEYQCPELDTLYQKKMGVMRGEGADFQQQRFIIVKSKTQEKYRVRNFLRQKFVPIVFLVILICAYKTYMKAGLRLHDQMPMPVSETRLRRYSSQTRHTHHHHRHHFRDIYFDYGVGGIGASGLSGGGSTSDDNNLPVGLHIPYEPSSPLSSNGSRSVSRALDGASSASTNTAGACTYGKYFVHPSDPPPSYDTLFPPSYHDLFYSSPSSNSSESSSTPTTNSHTKHPKV